MCAGNCLYHCHFSSFFTCVLPVDQGFSPSRWSKIYPLIFFVNGAGAVTFFFVLSGFVLTQNFFKRPSLSILVASVIKRLPRLMIPASVSIFIGLLILLYGGNQYKIASSISHSQWLEDFGNACFPLDFYPSFLDAVKTVPF